MEAAGQPREITLRVRSLDNQPCRDVFEFDAAFLLLRRNDHTADHGRLVQEPLGNADIDDRRCGRNAFGYSQRRRLFPAQGCRSCGIHDHEAGQ